jgi:hypothetical protein
MFSSSARRGWLGCVAGAAGLLVAVTAAGGPQSQPPDRKQQERLNKEQREEAQALLRVVDNVMKGQPAPADFALAWHNDFLKGQQGRVYVPFTLSFDRDAVKSRDLSLYFRVVARKAEAPEAAKPAAREEERREDKPAPQMFAYEDIHLVELQEPPKGQPHKVRRAFMVPPGDYDVFVAMRERKLPRGQQPKVTVLKQAVTVPDYWNGELTTSSVIVADNVQQLQAPLSPEEQAKQPYTIGLTQITPAADMVFSKSEELSVMFIIYNPALKDKKPDVTVEWKFHHRTPEGEKYFNKTEPTQLNANTLPPQFDLDLGHQLVAGQSVPLASFPEGDYRLAIEVTDNLAHKTLTRDVFFTVVGS